MSAAASEPAVADPAPVPTLEPPLLGGRLSTTSRLAWQPLSRRRSALQLPGSLRVSCVLHLRSRCAFVDRGPLLSLLLAISCQDGRSTQSTDMDGKASHDLGLRLMT